MHRTADSQGQTSIALNYWKEVVDDTQDELVRRAQGKQRMFFPQDQVQTFGGE
jgi:hypothetical protein